MALLRTFRDLTDAVFLLAALGLALISVALISTTFRDHLRNYRFPSLQMCCLRILALAPVCAILSWLMMAFLPLAPFLEVLRDMYETYTLYCYWVLLVLWSGGERRVVEVLAAGGSNMADCMLCPLLPAHGCPKVTGLTVARFQSARNHFRYWRLAIFQWMVIKPGLTLIHGLLISMHYDGLIRAKYATMLSTAVGMHAVLDTYSCLLPHLKGLQGSVKFLCIKLVVGVTLVQQAAMSALLGYGAIPNEAGNHGYSAAERAQRLLSTMTIVEMAIFSLLLSYVFSRSSLQRADSGNDCSASARSPQRRDKILQSTSSKALVSQAGGDLIPRQGKGALLEEAGAWETLDSGTSEEELEGLELHHQVLALWDIVLWRAVEDRHPALPSGWAPPVPSNSASGGIKSGTASAMNSFPGNDMTR